MEARGTELAEEGRPPKGSEWYPGVAWEAEAPLIRDLGSQKAVSELGYVRSITAALRGSEQEPWPQIRQRVDREGIDTRTAALADFFPTRARGGYLGLVVTPDRRAFSFFLKMSDAGQPENRPGYLGLGAWRELSTPEELAPYADQIRLGLQVLSADS